MKRTFVQEGNSRQKRPRIDLNSDDIKKRQRDYSLIIRIIVTVLVLIFFFYNPSLGKLSLFYS